MNAAEFYSLLRHPELLKNIDKAALEQLVREYLYFQTAHFLVAKKSHLDHESNFESKLNLAAAYANDRVKLFELINQKLSVQEAEQLDEAIYEEKMEELIASESELKELLKSVHERKQQILH